MGQTALLSLPKEGVLRVFFALKNPTPSAGFEPTYLGTKGQHATSRPPKPLSCIIIFLQYNTLKISGESLRCITSFIYMLLPFSSAQVFSLALYCTEYSVMLLNADSLCVAAIDSCNCFPFTVQIRKL